MNFIKVVPAEFRDKYRHLWHKFFLNNKERQKYLEARKQEFPTCTLSDTANLQNVQLGKQVVVHNGVNLTNVTVGNHSYFASSSAFDNVIVGSYCSIGSHVSVGLPRHPVKYFVSTYPAFFAKKNLGCLESFVNKQLFDDSPKKTKIEHDVWIGNNVIIPGGVCLGTGSIVAAGSVVVKDVPPYAIVGGNPAKVIRYRFSEEDIVFLLNSQWWDLSDDKLTSVAPYFSNIQDFRRALTPSGEAAE